MNFPHIWSITWFITCKATDAVGLGRCWEAAVMSAEVHARKTNVAPSGPETSTIGMLKAASWFGWRSLCAIGEGGLSEEFFCLNRHIRMSCSRTCLLCHAEGICSSSLVGCCRVVWWWSWRMGGWVAVEVWVQLQSRQLWTRRGRNLQVWCSLCV